MAKVGQYVNWLKKDKDEDWLDFILREDRKVNELVDKGLDSYKKTGSVLNCVISFPYADGKAFYIVGNVAPLILNPIPFCDAYTLPEWQLRGLEVEDIKQILDRDIAMQYLFDGGL